MLFSLWITVTALIAWSSIWLSGLLGSFKAHEESLRKIQLQQVQNTPQIISNAKQIEANAQQYQSLVIMMNNVVYKLEGLEVLIKQNSNQ